MDSQNYLNYNLPCDSRLGLDTAEIKINTVGNTYRLVTRSEDCFNCEFLPLPINENGQCNQIITHFPWELKVYSQTGIEVASKTYSFGEHGRYEINAMDTNSNIDIITTSSPKDSFAPLWGAFLIITSVIIIYTSIEYMYKKGYFSSIAYRLFRIFYYTRADSDDEYVDVDRKASDLSARLLSEESAVIPGSEDASKSQTKKRLGSLDTFRGFSLATMIFVNYGGGGYWFFDHSSWNGLTVADLLFPFFLFMMGVSMYLSFKSLAKAGQTSSAIMWKVMIRSAKLFALGLFLNNGFNLKEWRIPGVLQYFAFSYAITAAIVVGCKDYVIKQNSNFLLGIGIGGWCTSLTEGDRSMLAYWPEWVFQIIIVVLYLSIHLGTKAPGCPVGYQGPGGLADSGQHADCTGGVHRYIDQQLFGPAHIYGEPTCVDLYGCVSFDPEGALGGLTACTVAYLGLTAGRVLHHFEQPSERVRRWWFMGFILLFAAGGMCGFTQNDGWVPVNKNMWTTSFGLCMAGAGTICLSITYLLVDVWNVWNGAPFIYMGMNSILLYAGHEIFEEYFPFAYSTDSTSHARLLQRNLLGAGWWMVIAYYCFKIKFFAKI